MTSSMTHIISVPALGESTEWLRKDPATWPTDPGYIATNHVVRGLVGVNDPAERLCGDAKKYKVRLI